MGRMKTNAERNMAIKATQKAVSEINKKSYQKSKLENDAKAGYKEKKAKANVEYYAAKKDLAKKAKAHAKALKKHEACKKAAAELVKDKKFYTKVYSGALSELKGFKVK